MKKIIFGTIISVSIFSYACCKKHTTDSGTKQSDLSKEGYSKGMVVNMRGKLDGCGILIKLDDGTKLEPGASLNPEFAKDSLKVWVKYTDDPGRMSICMSGKIVKLTDIKVR